MKNLLLPLAALLMGASTSAQDVFALTGKSSSQIIFNDFRALDLQNDNSGRSIFSAESVPNVFSQRLKSKFAEAKGTYHNSQFQVMANLAEDQAGNLIYTPMYSSNVYVINRKSGNLTLVENSVIKTTACDISSHFTRMASGYDGAVYLLNNAGTSLVKITNNRGEYALEDLGAVKTVSNDPAISLSVMTSGYGGDMVADAENNFYIFAASGNVFKLNTGKMEAVFVGKIDGLPENYSLNGAAVLENGKVMVASAKGSGFYQVDINSLQATAMNKGNGLPVYDLASNNFLNNRGIAGLHKGAAIEIYPTKIDQEHVNIRAPKGTYQLEVFDAAGSRVHSGKMSVSGEEKIDLQSLTKGVYIINVKDESGKILATRKVIVTR